ncbi:Galactose oxidase [Gracilaria domingensis]|nr:Galactose oxidase [Gracilaria domingensis]
MTNLLDTPIVLVFAGEDETGQLLNDMYALHIERREWKQISYARGPTPLPRLLHTAVAISSTLMVVIGGDTWEATDSAEATTALNDIWVFNYSDSSWKQVKNTGSVELPFLSCSSAVFGRAKSQVPGVYIFGGYSRDKTNFNVVYRLRISDWKLEVLPHVEKDASGNKRIVDRNGEDDPKENEEYGERVIPRDRESHGAIWLPGIGMLVVGGDGGVSILGDCWLFCQHPDDPKSWRWQELRLVPAGNRPGNQLPRLAGHSLVALPTNTFKVMVWGGILNTGQEVMASTVSYVIELDRANTAQTVRVTNTGKAPKTGRILHGLVRSKNMLFAFGGCDSEGNIQIGTQYGRLLPNFKAPNQAASYFGSEAMEMAMRGTHNEKSDADEKKPANTGEKNESIVASRIPVTGKVLEEMDMGLLVSIEVGGKPFKGVLVALEGDDDAEMVDVSADGKQTTDGQRSKNSHVKPSKRPKLDAAAEALPDSPPTLEVRPARAEVIQLE